MDTLSSVMDGHRARGASLLRCEMRAPWALRIEDDAAVGVIVMIRGVAWLAPTSGRPVRLAAGDIGVVKGPRPYVFADAPDTPPTIVIEPGNVCRSLTGEHLAVSMGLGTRTWGNAGRVSQQVSERGSEQVSEQVPVRAGASGATPAEGDIAAAAAAGETTFLSATWELASQVTGRLLDALPEVAVVRAGEVDPALADLLAREVQRDLPGQDVVLDRLVDLVLVASLRQWFARPGSAAPAWWSARSDPVVGTVLGLLHDEPARDWTLEGLAAAVHVSRATLSRRFTELVGRSPMAYLAQWRLAWAADLLRTTTGSVEQVARQVGYSSAFAFSTAFRREHGLSPRAFRAAATSGVTSPVDPESPGTAREVAVPAAVDGATRRRS